MKCTTLPSISFPEGGSLIEAVEVSTSWDLRPADAIMENPINVKGNFRSDNELSGAQ
jgi:hypothetical protein